MMSNLDLDEIIPQIVSMVGDVLIVPSTANWSYNEAGFSYDQALEEYGNPEALLDEGPKIDVDDFVPLVSYLEV